MGIASLLKQKLFSTAAAVPEPDPLTGIDPFAAEQIRQQRYCRLLEPGRSEDPKCVFESWKALEQSMAMVPAGQVHWSGYEPVPIEAFYLDRCAVTNRDFAQFVLAGGYDEMEWWPREIWPSVVQFVDQSGLTGPRFWSEGKPPDGKLDHPVAGVSWFEANAYAIWAGKRLPRSAEWEWAGTWPSSLRGHGGNGRYPWGNAFDPAKANIWSGGVGDTVPVRSYEDGCTPNGVYQLIGNVWEWAADQYLGPQVPAGISVTFDQPMAEVRGGAFDTYFETQATCQFKSGHYLLSRIANTGFRCVIGAAQLKVAPELSEE